MREFQALLPAFAFAAALLPTVAYAQTVNGRLLDNGTGAPVEGAEVLLLTPTDSVLGRALTGRTGAFRIRAPAPESIGSGPSRWDTRRPPGRPSG